MQKEQTHRRSLAYSAFHRTLRIAKLLRNDYRLAQSLTTVDIDVCLWIEWDEGYKQVIALLEVAIDNGHKTATILQDLARRANVPAYVVLYTEAATLNPVDPTVPDIARFRLRRLHPNPERAYRIYTPEEYAWFLVHLRESQVQRTWRDAIAPGFSFRSEEL
jgi:hypothetical protein